MKQLLSFQLSRVLSVVALLVAAAGTIMWTPASVLGQTCATCETRIPSECPNGWGDKMHYKCGVPLPSVALLYSCCDTSCKSGSSAACCGGCQVHALCALFD